MVLTEFTHLWNFLQTDHLFHQCYNIYINKIYTSEYDSRQSLFFYTTWNWSFLPNNIRDFTLKRTNAKIFLNAQIAHFNNDIQPFCTWCIRYPHTDPPKETNHHFYFTCPTTYKLLESYFGNIFDSDIDIEKLIFKGHVSNFNFEMIYINIEVALFLYFLYDSGQKKKLPSLSAISIAVCFTKKNKLFH